MTISAQLTPPASPSSSRSTPSTHDPGARRDPHARRAGNSRTRPGSSRSGAERPTARRPAVSGPAGELRADHTTPPDAFALLDHRTRTRSVALADAPPGRYLSAEDGDEVRLVALDQPIVHIGRGLNADIRVEDPQVSRRHAIIAQRGDGARVLDDRSSNGTHVNGRAVTVGYLNDGDVLRLGSVVLRFVEIGPVVRAQPLRRFPLAVVARRQVIASAG
jgi:hypothetical protein